MDAGGTVIEGRRREDDRAWQLAAEKLAQGSDLSPKAQTSQRRMNLPASSKAEERMGHRFAGITPEMLCSEKIAIFSTHQLQSPPGFEHVWVPMRDHLVLSEKEIGYLVEAAAALVLTDIHDREHMQRTFNLATAIANQLEADAPPMVLVPHSTYASMDDQETLERQLECHSQSMFTHIDSVILGEPIGIRLAADVQSSIMQQKRQAERLNDLLNAGRKACQDYACMEEENHEAVWEYTRLKLKTGIPCIDDGIGPGQPDTLDNFIVGGKLGEGSYGTVCRLLDPKNVSASSGQVLKLILKKPLTHFHGIASLKRELHILNMLSSQEHQHPSIMKLYEVYHTETHILLRMEDGGKLDLYKRLALREVRAPELPLGVGKATAILSDCMAGLCHLHLQVNVVHRDLKPENLIVSEKADSLYIKLADFDIAALVTPDHTRCTGKVGTFPFMAPEVMRAHSYDPFAADIWSMGVVFFEVICRLNVLKMGVGLHSVKKVCDKKAKEAQMMQKIEGFFSVPSNAKLMSQKYIHPDLRTLLDDSQTLLDGMLTVSVVNRWRAPQLQEARSNLLTLSAASGHWVTTSETLTLQSLT